MHLRAPDPTAALPAAAWGAAARPRAEALLARETAGTYVGLNLWFGTQILEDENIRFLRGLSIFYFYI